MIKKRYYAVQQTVKEKCPIICQCIKKTTITGKALLSKVTKLAIQMSTKLGGSPWGIKEITYIPLPTMVVGVDIYKHLGKETLGFTATMANDFTKLYSRVGIDKDLKGFFHDSILRFKTVVKYLPIQILIYRDGLSEGDIITAQTEIKTFKDVIGNLKLTEKERSPEICYMVINKRIHTRLFNEGDDKRYYNPNPGTIVDSEITNGFEFFLVAQQVTQGTATPVRYRCIKNEFSHEKKLSVDQIQLLTFQLCHLYFNWFGTIRVPAPALYATKIATIFGNANCKEDPKTRLADRIYYI